MLDFKRSIIALKYRFISRSCLLPTYISLFLHFKGIHLENGQYELALHTIAILQKRTRLIPARLCRSPVNFMVMRGYP